jgi:hypothetical protein
VATYTVGNALIPLSKELKCAPHVAKPTLAMASLKVGNIAPGSSGRLMSSLQNALVDSTYPKWNYSSMERSA